MRLVNHNIFLFYPLSGKPTTWEVYLTTVATYPVAAPWDYTSIDGHWLAEERNKNQFTATQQTQKSSTPLAYLYLPCIIEHCRRRCTHAEGQKTIA